MRIHAIIKIAILAFSLCLTLFSTVNSIASTKPPLVILVHGVAGGNRPDTWSDEAINSWGLDKENTATVTFRAPGRDANLISAVDFASQSGIWALSVQKQLKKILDANPGRKIILVTHSWGNVVTSLALQGGTGAGSYDVPELKELEENDYHINPIKLNSPDERITEWVSLASPLGRANDADVHTALNLQQLQVEVYNTKPALVDKWVNIYAKGDPVANQSHNLDNADENIGVEPAAYPFENWPRLDNFLNHVTFGLLSGHSGIWTNPPVVKLIKNTVNDLTVANATTPATAPKPPTPVQRPKPAPPEVAPPAPVNTNITVTVVDETGSAIPNAQVELSGASSVTGDTNGSGQVRFTDVLTGDYAASASAEGYQSSSRQSTMEANIENTIPFVLKKNVAEGSLAMTVTVVNNQSTPIPNATIILSGPQSARAIAANGSTVFNNLPEGTYSVQVSAEGYDADSQAFTLTPEELALSVMLTPKPTTKPLPLQSQGVAVQQDPFEGIWEGSMTVTNSKKKEEMGKTSALSLKFVKQSENHYMIYSGKDRLDDPKNMLKASVIYKDNTLQVDGIFVIFLVPCDVSATLTSKDNIITGQISMALFKTQTVKTNGKVSVTTVMGPDGKPLLIDPETWSVTLKRVGGH